MTSFKLVTVHCSRDEVAALALVPKPKLHIDLPWVWAYRSAPYLIVLQYAAIVINLFPWRTRAADGTIEGSDGYLIWRVLRHGVDNGRAIYASLIGPYAEDDMLQMRPSKSGEVIFGIFSDLRRHIDTSVRRRGHATLLREFERRRLTRPEELPLLDAVITNHLILTSCGTSADLAVWVQRLDDLAPNATTMHDTNGAALCSIGPYTLRQLA